MNQESPVLKAVAGGFILLWIAARAAAAPARETWGPGEVIEPRTLSQELSSARSKPLVIQVGFREFYDQARIPGALFCGPGYKPEGLEQLRACVEKVSRTRDIVIYCGCCPWKNCPNIRPAFRELKSLGFHRVKALEIRQDFDTDWVEQGLPTVKGP